MDMLLSIPTCEEAQLSSAASSFLTTPGRPLDVNKPVEVDVFVVTSVSEPVEAEVGEVDSFSPKQLPNPTRSSSPRTAEGKISEPVEAEVVEVHSSSSERPPDSPRSSSPRPAEGNIRDINLPPTEVEELETNSSPLEPISAEADLQLVGLNSSTPAQPTDAGSEAVQSSSPGQQPDSPVPAMNSSLDVSAADGIVRDEPHNLPEVSTGSRKRMRNESNWARNVRKLACNSGAEYTSQKGVLRAARKMGKGCSETCMYDCHSRISQEDREAFFRQFWDLKDKTRQWDFINSYVSFTDPSRPLIKDTPLRSVGRYHMMSNREKIVVCQTMFLSTLDISEKPIRTAAARLKSKGAAISPDHRGQNSKIKKDAEKVKGTIDEHIKMFPIIPSHLCRGQNPRRRYLQPGLSINKMYIAYVQFMKEKHPDMTPATARQYRDRFVTGYNLGFFVPRKDQCELCNIHERATPAIRAKIQRRLDDHLRNKDAARKLRNADTQQAKKDPKVCVAVFDLEKVLLSPKDETGVNYYKCKIGSMNLTFFETAPLRATCFVWHEGEAKRGGNEVASCLNEFATAYESEHKDVEEFRFWADNCYGQNKNKFVFTNAILMSQRLKKKITIRYMETGHTQSACDSVHKNIEEASKGRSVFSPEEWFKLIEEDAKVIGEKYRVVRMAGKIMDVRSFCAKYTKWNGHNINWKNVREISFDPNTAPGTVTVKTSLEEGAPSRTINVMKTSRGRPPNLETHLLKPAYDGPLQLKAKKLFDLGTLCGSQIIPVERHAFYLSLVGFKIIEKNFEEMTEENFQPRAEDECDEEGTEEAQEELLEGNDEVDPDFGRWFREELKNARVVLAEQGGKRRAPEREAGKGKKKKLKT